MGRGVAVGGAFGVQVGRAVQVGGAVQVGAGVQVASAGVGVGLAQAAASNAASASSSAAQADVCNRNPLEARVRYLRQSARVVSQQGGVSAPARARDGSPCPKRQ